jgi:integrase
MFTLAVDAGKLLARPKIRMLQEDNARQGFFEVEQFEAVLRHLPAPLQTVATFAYFTGWRRSEILGLEWSRVDRKAGIVRLDVGTTKNKDGREFIYRDIADVKRVIDQQWEKHEGAEEGEGIPRVRFGPTGEGRDDLPARLSSEGEAHQELSQGVAEGVRVGRVPGSAHARFPRTAVRNLERAGVSRSVATAITGHKTEAVYRRYAIVSSGDLADAARKLQAMTGTITGTIGLAVDNTENAKASA